MKSNFYAFGMLMFNFIRLFIYLNNCNFLFKTYLSISQNYLGNKLNVMIKLLVVLISWKLTAQLKMIALAYNVVKFMSDNVLTFATPDVILATLKSAADRAQLAYNNRANGEEGRLEYINAAAALDILLHSQANYVNKIAKGDASIIAKAGYKSTSSSITKKVITESPGPAALKTNAGGGLTMTLISVVNATSYIYVVFMGVVGTIVVGSNYVKPSIEAIVITNGKLIEKLRGITAGTIVTVIPFARNSAGISPAGPKNEIMVN